MTNHKPSLADLISMPLLIVVRNKNMKSEQYVIIAIVIGSTIAPLGAGMAFGQLSDETSKLTALGTELKTYGFSFAFDLKADGSMVEFKTDSPAEYQQSLALNSTTANSIISSYGFTLVDFQIPPATPAQDSTIIVGVRA